MSIVAEFRNLMTTVAASNIVNLLKHADDSFALLACTEALPKLSDYGKIVTLLGLALLISIITIAELQPSIENAIPGIITLLNNSDKDVCVAGTDTLSKLSKQGKRLNLSGLALLINIIAEFQPLIGKAIPEVIALLNNSDEDIQKAGTDALSTLSGHGEKQFMVLWSLLLALLISIIAEYRPLIGTAIPEFITLLKDSDVYVRMAATDALSKLSNYSKSVKICGNGVILFIKIIAEFRDSIGTAIPDILTLLKGRNKGLQKAGINALSKLSEHGKRVNLWGPAFLICILAEFRDSIMGAIPDIVNFLSDSSWAVRDAGADALSKLSDHGMSVNYQV